MKFLHRSFNWITSAIISLFLFSTAENTFAQRPLGIDVSMYQYSINWTNVVQASGITFTWIKATESDDYTDPYFTTNVPNAKELGVLSGFYHFAHPERNIGLAGADAEAAYFWGVVSNYVVNDGLTIMPVLDYETTPGTNYTKATSSQWVNRWCLDIVNYGNSNGVILNPVVYTDTGIANSWLDSTVTQWPLWRPSNSSNPQTGAPSATSPWSTWTAWQYGQTSLNGITNNVVDEDVFNGTAATLKSTLGVGSYNPTIYYWDPQGTNGTNPYTNSLTGNWEDSSWSQGFGGRITPVGWFESKAACIGVATGLGTPPFTITMNQNHTVAGIFNGALTPDACNVTLNGTGIMTILGAQGFGTLNSSDGSLGITTISNVIAGTGEMIPEYDGQLGLNGVNTYSGGTVLGYSHAAFPGTINFNNNSSFGSGKLTLSAYGNGATLAAEGNLPITIPNSVLVSNSTTNIFIGNPAGVTYSGNWTLGTSKFTLKTGSTPGLVDIISGMISGSAGLTVAGSGTLILQGADTYTGNTTIASPCLLTIGGDGQLGLGAYSYNITNGGTFTYASSATQILSGVISGSGSLNQNGPGTLTLSGANTYTGNTAVNTGTLALNNSAPINNSPLISIGAGGTLDVSAINSFSLSTNTTLSASGNTPLATIIGGSISLGSQPIILNYDGSHPALTISQGALSLNGNAFTVNGSTLAPGVYSLIHQTSGGIASSVPCSVAGTAIPATGATSAISASGGDVFLTITDATTTTLTPLVPSTYGQSATFTATVAPVPIGGSIQFYDTGGPLGNAVTVSGGIASFSTNTLSVGNHPITASYSGAIGYAASSTTNSSIQQVILPPNTAPVTISGTSLLVDGTLQLNFSGLPGYTYLIQAATNLNPPAAWTNLSTNVADINGLFNFTDLDVTNYDGRYYRTSVQ